MSKSEEITGILILCVLLLVPIAGASYSFDGVPYTDKLDLVAHGTLKGGVYIGESQKLDFPPCTRTFNVPGEVKWARLYVGVWGVVTASIGSITRLPMKHYQDLIPPLRTPVGVSAGINSMAGCIVSS
jgi:hypothetical protein